MIVLQKFKEFNITEPIFEIFKQDRYVLNESKVLVLFAQISLYNYEFTSLLKHKDFFEMLKIYLEENCLHNSCLILMKNLCISSEFFTHKFYDEEEIVY